MEPAITENNNESIKKTNPLFKFMGIGSLIYAFFYTLFLYKNESGITYPFFVGGTCFFFSLYLRRSGITAKKTSIFIMISIILFGISTCLTDSWILILLNKTGIFFLFFYLTLHNLYEDKDWNISKYICAILNVVCTSFAFIFSPFSDFYVYYKDRKTENNKTEGKIKYIFIGIIISLPLLFIILILLCSADAVFGNMINKLFVFDIDLGEHFWGITFSFLFAFFASYSILCRLSLHNIKEEVIDKRTIEPVIGITFTGIISVIYLFFCLIQIIYLFGGWGTLPENYTYASYAREGFFQLVFVCLINLAIVLICMKYFRENRILNITLTFISGCTYIMIASSAYRMLLYIQAYYLTFLRVFVLWSLFVIFLLMTGALIVVYKKKFPFTKYCIITVTICYLILSFAHPDYWIACYNLDHSMSETGKVFDDYYYLRCLSDDAAPAIFDKAKEYGYEETKWFRYYTDDIINSVRASRSYTITANEESPENLPIRKWNLSRWTAVKLYKEFYNLI